MSVIYSVQVQMLLDQLCSWRWLVANDLVYMSRFYCGLLK